MAVSNIIVLLVTFVSMSNIDVPITIRLIYILFDPYRKYPMKREEPCLAIVTTYIAFFRFEKTNNLVVYNFRL